MAAQSSISRSLNNPKKDFQVNLLSVVNLLEKSKQIKIKRIIFASSAAIFGEVKKLPIDENYPKNPISYYGISKLCAEYFFQNYYKNYQIPYICLRLANVYGPRQDASGEGGVIAIFANRIIKGKPIIIYGSGDQTRDFIYVSDVVDAFIKSLKEDINGEFNIGTSQQTSINQVTNKLIGINDPNQPVTKIHKPQRFLEVEKSSLSHQKFKRSTGFQPKVGLDDGLAKTINYFRITSR